MSETVVRKPTVLNFGQVNILELDRIELMRVEDDPTNPKPFRIGYNDFSVEQMAAITASFLTVMISHATGLDYHAVSYVRDALTCMATGKTLEQ